MEVEGSHHIILVDARQIDPAREIVRHWERQDFDRLLEAALGGVVLLAERPSNPEIDAIYAEAGHDKYVGRSPGRLFAYRGNVYQAPTTWEAPDALEWIEIRRGVQRQKDPELVEPWADSVEESYCVLDARARSVISALEFSEEVESARRLLDAGLLPTTHQERPLREALPSSVKREVWRRDEGRCVECGNKERLEFDHIIPLSRGGANTVRNIQLLCEACNRRKGVTI